MQIVSICSVGKQYAARTKLLGKSLFEKYFAKAFI